VAVAIGETPKEGLQFHIRETIGRTVIVELAGEIDLRTGELLRVRLFELADADVRSIVIDFADVQFCDATGLGVLVAVRNRLHAERGQVLLAQVRPAQRRLLRAAGLDQVFALYDSVADAVRADQEPTASSRG
jgi:anti-anti-sigma factor